MLAIVLITLLALLLPATVAVADEIVTFPDPNLQAAIRQAIGKPAGDILQSDLDGLTYLNASYRGIADLVGLEHCTNLAFLNLSNNQIINLSPLVGLTNLTYLYVDTNQISNLSPLAGLTNLIHLPLECNQISDISPLSGLTSLTSLILDSNQISNLSPLAGLTNLTGLFLNSNQISNLSPLAGLTNLEYLHLSSNQISNLSPLVGLTNLIHLPLECNQISDISPLSGLTSLTSLILNSNQISDLKPLVNNPGLSSGDTVYVEDNPLNSISVNTYIPQLQARGVTVYYDAPPPTPTPSGNETEKQGCFIATAAYGSYLDSHVQTLRDFRDSYMVTNPVGRGLVSAYYRLSPPIAEFIDNHPSLKPMVRVGLLPAVVMSTVAVNTTLAEKIGIVGSVALVSFLMLVWLRRSRQNP
jgi:hypothetical protein